MLHGFAAKRKAAAFAASVRPGHTYYSVLDNNAQHPGAPERILLEWTFTAPGWLLSQEPRCGHLTATGAWLSYGPLYAKRPGELKTLRELGLNPPRLEA